MRRLENAVWTHVVQAANACMGHKQQVSGQQLIVDHWLDCAAGNTRNDATWTSLTTIEEPEEPDTPMRPEPLAGVLQMSQLYFWAFRLGSLPS